MGSPNLLCTHALNASLKMLLDRGLSTIEREVSEKVDFLIEKLEQIPGCTILSPKQKPLRAGIVTFKINGADHHELYRRLMDNRVICACRGGGIRFSPHFHTPEGSLQQAVDQVKALAGLSPE